MLNIAICDDEENARTYLASLIRRQNVECSITEYAMAEDYLKGQEKYDLLFLDIGMEEMDGMALARMIRARSQRQPIIIFVTGFEDYVYEAFDVSAFQYLLKPIQEEKFVTVFYQALHRIKDEVERQRKRVPSIHVSQGGMNRVIPIRHVSYIESFNHKVILHTREGEQEYYARLRDLEMELEGEFFRIHKGYLVNLSYVDGYSRQELVLSGGEKLQISKYKYAEFVKAYLRFMEKED